MTQRIVGMASMCSMTFLQVDRCSNEPFSTYCVYCIFYEVILRILRILQIVILEYCVYCVFYKLTSDNIAYIAYVAYIALRCVAYFTTSLVVGEGVDEYHFFLWALNRRNNAFNVGSQPASTRR